MCERSTKIYTDQAVGKMSQGVETTVDLDGKLASGEEILGVFVKPIGYRHIFGMDEGRHSAHEVTVVVPDALSANIEGIPPQH